MSVDTYDPAGRVVSVTDPLGKADLAAYDQAGQLVEATDRTGRRRVFGYDPAGRRSREEWLTPAGASVQVQQYGYDPAGHLTLATDPDGDTLAAYDAAGRPVSVTGPAGVTLTSTYDPAGNRTRAADGTGGVEASAYDPAGRVHPNARGLGRHRRPGRLHVHPRGEEATLARSQDAAGLAGVATTAYAYDPAGRTRVDAAAVHPTARL